MSELFNMETLLLAAASAGANAAAERDDDAMARYLRNAVDISLSACHHAMKQTGERP